MNINMNKILCNYKYEDGNSAIVKMATCPPIGGDGTVPDILDSPSGFPQSNLNVDINQGITDDTGDKTDSVVIGCEKVYEKVATLEENELKNFLEEVVSRNKKKDTKSFAQILLRKEEDALREESGSGEDTIDLVFKRQRKKRLLSKRDPHYYRTHPTIVGSPAGCSPSHGSAASRTTTGGSLGSLHDLTDQTNVPSEQAVTTTTASRSRGGGSCGNLSRGSFETQAPSKRRRRREGKRASTSQSEGGSLQNLSKAEVACHESKKLHKSGSLSHVFSDVGGARVKTRRQKTSSESSSSRLLRRSEERDVEESSEEEVGDIPYMPLATSPQMASNPEGGSLSEPPSGESTEDESESVSHISARSKLGNDSFTRHSQHHHHHHYSGHHSDNDAELHTIITHSAHRDVLPTISSDSEVDKPIKYGIVQEESLSPSPPILLPISSSNIIFDSIASKSISKNADDVVEKRKLRSTKSEGGNIEKLDENGNPVLMSVKGSSGSHSSSISALQSCADRHTNIIPSITRRSGFTSSKDNMSTYNRLKAKQDKKKAIKEKDVMPSEKTPGYRGDASLDTLLKFLGAEDSSNTKVKKKQKKKEDVKDELKRNKVRDKFEDGKDKFKMEDNSDGNASESSRDRKSEENLRKGWKKDRKRENSGMRESLSIEDLVSKSKQNDNVKVKDFKKQVTLDDGAMNLSSDTSFKSGRHEGESDSALVDEAASEFTSEFYKIGDPLLESDVISGGTAGTGDFQVINRKRGRKNKYENVQSKNVSEHLVNEDHRSYGTMRGGGDGRRGYHSSNYSKPHINFNEAPRTAHEGAFFSRWNGGNKSSNNSGGYATTTSAPHSEDSDSDGGDSVHSMPAHTTPRAYVRRPPPSSNTTPQASYANITKLAFANKGQVKVSPTASNQVNSSVVPIPFVSPIASVSDNEYEKGSIEPDVSHSNNDSIVSILDENFPPLAESFLSPTSISSGNSGKPPDPNKAPDLKSSFETSSSIASADSPYQKRDSDSLNSSVCTSKQSFEVNSNNLSNYISGIKVNENNDKHLATNASPEFISRSCSTVSVNPQVSTALIKTPQVNSQQSNSITNKLLNSSHVYNSVCSVNNNNNSNNKDNNSVKSTNKSHAKDRAVIKTSSKSKENNIFVPNGSVRRKFEEAVIFTDNAKFNLSVSDIEFGFDLDAISNITDKKVNNLKIFETAQRTSGKLSYMDSVNSSNNNMKNSKNIQASKRDFSKLYLAPKNDNITYNYEELCRHVSKEWVSAMKLLEEDPKNIAYWNATIVEDV